MGGRRNPCPIKESNDKFLTGNFLTTRVLEQYNNMQPIGMTSRSTLPIVYNSGLGAFYNVGYVGLALVSHDFVASGEYTGMSNAF